jgi:RNA polymerase sigma factor (sigma-70 family)
LNARRTYTDSVPGHAGEGSEAVQSISDTAAGHPRTESADERCLLERVAARDEVAFERLYRRYYARLLQFIAGMVSDRGAAEEAVNDAMFVVWTNAERYEGRASVSTWLFGIAYRRALKVLERSKRLRRLDHDDEFVATVPDDRPESDPLAQVAGDDLRQRIRAAIANLSEDHRAVMLLAAQGYSYEEIAAIVDSPANTVRTRMFYARQHVKKSLADAPATSTDDTRRTIAWPHRTRLS